jgi:hypothetical protein
MMKAAMIAVLALLPMANGPTRDPVEAKKTQAAATKLFRARRVRDACERFERAVTLDPTDGALHADLGLCLEKLGENERAVAENLAAVKLGDDRTRLNSYFNLASLGHGVPLPKPGTCADLDAPAGCSAKLGACGFAWSQSFGAHMSDSGEAVRIWGTAAPGSSAEQFKAVIAAKDEWAAACYGAAHCNEFSFAPAGEPVPFFDIVVSSSLSVSFPLCAAEQANCGPLPSHERSCRLVVADGCRGLIGVVCKEEGRSPDDVDTDAQGSGSRTGVREYRTETRASRSPKQ